MVEGTLVLRVILCVYVSPRTERSLKVVPVHDACVEVMEDAEQAVVDKGRIASCGVEVLFALGW